MESVAVELPPHDHFHGFVLVLKQRDDLNLYAVFSAQSFRKPSCTLPWLTPMRLPLKVSRLIRGDVAVLRVNINIVGFRAHGQLGEGHEFLALRLEGHVAEQVDLPVLQHLQQVRPAVLHIFVGPAGVGGDLVLILIGDAAAPAELIPVAEGRIKPPYAHDLQINLPVMLSAHA